MKVHVRKIFLAVASLSVGTAAFAIAPAATTITNPCSNGWTIGVRGMYLQPLNDDLVYSWNSSFNSYPNGYSVTNTEENAIDTDYDWGYQAMLDYRIPNTTNDIELSYMSSDTSDVDKDKVATPESVYNFNAGGFTTLNTLALQGGGLFDNAVAKTTFDYDAVNLEAGHTFVFNELSLRLHGGLQYARINNQISVTGTNNPSSPDLNAPANTNIGPDSATQNNSTESNFHGIGPRIGLGMNYIIGKDFSAFADSGAELLVGSLQANGTSVYNNNSPADSTVTVNNYYGENQRTVVPGADAEAGINYTYNFSRNVAVTAEAGYYVAGYFHSIKHAYGSDGGEGAMGCCPSTSNFGMQGPFLGLAVSF